MSIRLIASAAEFKSFIAQPKLTVVDFFAKWCGPCKQIHPHIQALAQQRTNVNFLQVDVDASGDIAAEYGIRAMPTFLLFKNGAQITMFEGADLPQLKQLVEQHDVAPPPPIPADDVLAAMPAKELLALMKAHHISSQGLLEKSDYIEEIKKYR